jgi:Zn-finger nucleic acid-binding protein
MRCPVDNETLVMTDRNGVEIDYCPKCRGVWLDRGELDKIIDRAAGPSAPVPQAAAPVYQPEPVRSAPAEPRPRRDRDHDDDDDYRYRHKGKRRESFLSDLFDF